MWCKQMRCFGCRSPKIVQNDLTELRFADGWCCTTLALTLEPTDAWPKDGDGVMNGARFTADILHMIDRVRIMMCERV